MPIKVDFTTPQQLHKWLGDKYGFEPWPETIEVSPLLYARVFQATVNHMVENHLYVGHAELPNVYMISVATGPNKGIMFKNVELVMK